MSVEPINLRLIGAGSMLMRDCQLADPLNAFAKAIQALTSKRVKPEADHARIAELEWHGGLWLHEGKPCIPARCIKKVCVEGARKRNKGTIVEAAFQPDGPALLEYDGPSSLDKLWADERFSHREMVRVQGSLTPRTRPCFPVWSARISGTFITTMLNRNEVFEFFRLAGVHGLGDYRPEFGRFIVEEFVSP